MTGFKIGDKVWVKGVINQIDKGDVWDLYISTRENGVWIDSRLDECIPQNDTDEKPRYLRNVLARLRGLPEHDRKVWLKGIMDEFELDFSHAKWREGYEQGKFDGAVEAEKSNTVVIPQFVANIIEYYKKENAPIVDIFTEKDIDKEYAWWLATDFNAYDRVTRAWLDGYEVEQEKRYRIKMKNGDDYLVKTNNNDYHFYNNIYIQNRKHTREELEDAGFGWVFDCEGIEIEEVQDDTEI